MKIIISCLLLIVFVSPSLCQIDSTILAFYPLQIGNYWEYKQTLTDFPGPVIYISYFSVEVSGDTLMSNGLHYGILLFRSIPDTMFHTIYYERMDSLYGNVYRYNPRISNDEWLIDSLNSMIGDTSKASRYFFGDSVITVCKVVYNETILNHETTIKKFSNYNGYLSEYDYWIAKDFGLIKEEEWELPATTITLEFARINGIEYGTPVVLEDYNNSITNFNLFQNFPNPFNMSTTVKYEIPYPGEIEITLYDVLGKNVADLYKGYQSSGIHEININGIKLSSGIYYYSLKTQNYQRTRKCVMLK